MFSEKAKAFDSYFQLSEAECHEKIVAAKKTLGDQLMLLCHHYQRDEVFKHADASGDSLGLAKKAAASSAKYIVFCGVHFMAEVSDILTRDDQVTILPDLSAGCSMADMANLPAVERAWRELNEVIDVENEVTPITYINSSAKLKAFCGEHGGITCTSTNAEKILRWAFKQRPRALFFPDQHLGRNTAFFQMNIDHSEMALWDFMKPYGGLTHDQIKKAKIFLWKGFCSVHEKFKPEHIDNYKKQFPNVYVLAHPESDFSVCEKSDFMGSTSQIIQKIEALPHGTHCLVATEFNLVNRLNDQFKDQNKIVKFMSPTMSLCSTMFRIDPEHLAWVCDNLVSGNVVNQITVPKETATHAITALQRMFEIS